MLNYRQKCNSNDKAVAIYIQSYIPTLYCTRSMYRTRSLQQSEIDTGETVFVVLFFKTKE